MQALVVLLLVLEAVNAVPAFNQDNGHYYEIVYESRTWDDSKVAAESRTYLGLQGYLATITSPEEWTFIRSNVNPNNNQAWIGGSDAETEGIWKWTGGPERGQVIYSQYNPVQCYVYCNWNSGEPNQYGDEDSIVVGWGSNGEWNDYSPWNVLYFMVEYGDSSLVSIESPPTEGGLIHIVGLNFGSVASAMTVTIGGKNCTNITTVRPNLEISCFAPPGTGRGQQVTILVGNQTVTNDTSLFAYQAPKVLGVSSTDINGGATVINGANFGTEPSLVNITIDGTPCTGIAISVSHVQVMCQMPPGVGKNLAVSVVVDRQANFINSTSPTFTYAFACDHHADVRSTSCSTTLPQRTFDFDAGISQTNFFKWRTNCTGSLTAPNSKQTSLVISNPCTAECAVEVDICRRSQCAAADIAATCSSAVSVTPCSAVDVTSASISLSAAQPTQCSQNVTTGTLTWSGVKFAASYEYCVGSSQGVCDISGGWIITTATTANVMIPSYLSGIYYGHVRGINCGGTSPEISSTYTRTKYLTVPMPSASSLSAVLPSIYCTQQTAFVNVLWGNFFAYDASSVPAFNFHVCIDLSEGGSTCQVYSNSSSATSGSFRLSVGQTYTIKVRGENCLGAGPYQSVNLTVVPTICCPNNCSNVGTCYQNTCFCPPTRQGTDCSTVIYPPVIEQVTSIKVVERQVFIFTPVLLSGSGPISWSLISAPSGTSFNSTTGSLVWLNTQASVTPYQIQIAATNNLTTTTLTFPLYVDPSYYARISVSSPSKNFLWGDFSAGVLLNGYAAYVNASKGYARNVPVRVWINKGGFTQTISATTDSLGNFQVYYLDAVSGGSFTVGCSHPFYFNGTTQDHFDVFGLVASPSNGVALVDVSYDTETVFEGLVTVKNLGADAVTNLALANTQYSSNGVAVVASLNGTSIAGSSSVVLSFAITTSQDVARPNQTFTFNVTGTSLLNGMAVKTSIILQVQARPLRPVLSFSPAVLTGAVSKYGQAVIPFGITNSGRVAASALQVQVPSGQNWISSASSSFVPTIQPGSTATISLLLNPGNVTEIGQYSGSIQIVANSTALLSIPFKFSISSNVTGGLFITAVDEFTYYAEGAPKVANATVSLRLMSTTTTSTYFLGETGIFDMQLPEGYYDLYISAPEHAGYSATIQIVPGQTKKINAFMQRTLISYSWSVTPTIIEDEYTFTITSTFQTYVPAPVIVISPTKIDWADQIPDENGIYTFYFNVTNYGYVAAQHAAFDFSAGNANGFIFKSDIDGTVLELPGLSSRIVVVKAIPIDNGGSTTGVPLSTTSGTTSGNSGISTLSTGSGNSGNSDGSTGDSGDSSSGISTGSSTGSTTSSSSTGSSTGTSSSTSATSSTSGTSGTTSPTSGTTSGGGGNGGPNLTCFVVYLLYDIECDGPKYYRIPINYLGSRCGPQPAPSSGGGGGGGACCGGGGYIGPVYYVAEPTQCDPCLVNLKRSVYRCWTELVPSGGRQAAFEGPALDFYSNLAESAANSADLARPDDIVRNLLIPELGNKLKELTGIIPENIQRSVAKRAGGGGGFDLIRICITILEDIPCIFGGSPNRLSWMRAADPVVAGELFLQALQDVGALEDYFDYFFLYSEFYYCNSSDSCAALQMFLYNFGAVISDESDLGSQISSDEKDFLVENPDYLPDVDFSKVEEFIDYWNRTMNYYDQNIFLTSAVPNGDSASFLSFDAFEALTTRYKMALTNAHNAGYGDVEAAMVGRKRDLDAALENPPEGVCAKVKMQITQDAIVARSAFEAVLEVGNEGGQDLTNLFVEIIIKNVDGDDVTDQFVIGDPTPSGSMVLEPTGNGSVPAGTTGKNTWLMVPLNDLIQGPDSEAFYVGGVMTYTLGTNQLEIPLFAVAITVYPSPEFYIDYFHQAQVFSDDPFTPEIEPAEPFVIGVMIRNLGFGNAPGFKLTSGQPVITENEKGLVVNFQIVETRLGNRPASPSFTLDFGAIPSGSTSIAQFYLTSSLSGDFTSFDVTFEYRSPLGDDRLCQLEHLQIHELVHPVQFILDGVNDNLTDFLLNEVPDVDHLPDAVWLSDGTILSVTSFNFAAENTTISGTPEEPTLNINITGENGKRFVGGGPTASCSYYRIPDPFDLTLTIPEVIRSDGTQIKMPENAWRTHRIYHGQNGQVVENYLHIFDCSPTSSDVGYRVSFTPVSQNVTLRVTSTSSNSITISFTATDPAVIKWNIHYKKSTSSSWIQAVSDFPGNSLVIPGLTPNTAYNFAAYSGRLDGYSPTPATVTGNTDSVCNVGCPNGHGVLNATSCECNCLGSWLGTACTACGLTSCPANKVPNFSTCECECNSCPVHSVAIPSTCACDCIPPWTGTNCNQCGMLASECDEGYYFDPVACTCQCAILCQNGGQPTADPYDCACDCVGNWTGTVCDVSFVRPFTTGLLTTGIFSTGETEGLTSSGPTSSPISGTSSEPSTGDPIESASSGLPTTTIVAAAVSAVGGGFLLFGAVLGVVIYRRKKRTDRRNKREGPANLLSDEDDDDMIELPLVLAEQLKAVDFMINYDELSLDKEIGSGNFGRVYLGTWRGTEVAVKKLISENISEKALKEFQHELSLMKNLRPHRNVISLFGYCLEPLCIVTEFCSNGSLDSLVKSDAVITEKMMFDFARGIAAGMLHLHSENIIHRDLAARNVLIHHKDVKVADFGMSRINQAESNQTANNFGPIRWMSPESLKDSVYGVKTDVYSYGVTLFEIMTRQNPFVNIPLERVAIQVANSELSLVKFLPEDNDYPKLLVEIMKDCLNFNPDERPDFGAILERLKDEALE